MFFVCSMRAKPNGKPTTIAQARQTGVTNVRVWCEQMYCLHSEVFDIASFNLADDLPVMHIPRYRNFVCSKCGRRKISIRFEYPPAPGTPGYVGCT
jgi:hypothetical protein